MRISPRLHVYIVQVTPNRASNLEILGERRCIIIDLRGTLIIKFGIGKNESDVSGEFVEVRVHSIRKVFLKYT